MDISLYKIMGVIGLILIISGMIVKSRSKRDLLCFSGGILMFMYSTYLKDIIFTVLQAFYVLVTGIDFIKRKK
jgi:Ca2+/Na+ antiporter